MFFTGHAQSGTLPWNYLEVGVGVGIRQPGRAGVLLVLEGPVEGLGDGAEVEDAHSRGRNAVPAKAREKTKTVREPSSDRCPPPATEKRQ